MVKELKTFEDNFEEEEPKVIEEEKPVEEELKKVETEDLQKKLSFPLDLDTIFALTKGDFIIVGKATLVSGVIAITDRRIKLSSVAIVSHETVAGTIGVTLVGICTDGVLTITAKKADKTTETSEISVVSYLIILQAKST